MSHGGSGGWRLLRFVSYNPLTLAAGTQFRAQRQHPVQFLHTDKHIFWHAGHGPDSNRACGVAIGLHKARFPP
eukprot:1396676-Pyramimonas_sp.AAC.1